MAGNLFEQAIGGFFGQQDVPESSYYSPEEISTRINAAAPGIGAGNVAYNKSMAVPYAQINRDVENIYDPNQGALREATTTSILDQLRLGGSLPPDVEQAVRRAGLERGATSGIGGTGSGRNLVGRDLGLTSLDLLNKRIGTAAGYTRSAPTGNQLYQPQTTGFSPADVGSIAIANRNAENAANIYKAQIEARNARNLWEAPMDLGGKAWGYYTGHGGGNVTMAQAPQGGGGGAGGYAGMDASGGGGGSGAMGGASSMGMGMIA